MCHHDRSINEKPPNLSQKALGFPACYLGTGAAPLSRKVAAMQHFGDNFIPVIPVDEREHAEDKPFCWDTTCPCHEDETLIREVAQQVQDGLLTPEEATEFTKGRTI